MKPNLEKIENIEWVILDAMGVIYKFGDDVNELLIPYLRKLNPKISSKKVNELYARASLAEISSKQFWKELNFENNYPEIERSYLDECLEIDPESIEFLSALKTRYQLAMLSNDVKDWSQYLRNKYRLDDFLKVAVISGEVGFRKPDEKIYLTLLKQIQAEPSRCLFVDDRERNLISAQKLGFKTILFSRQKDHDGTGGFRGVSSFGELKKLLQ